MKCNRSNLFNGLDLLAYTSGKIQIQVFMSKSHEAGVIYLVMMLSRYKDRDVF